jgi:aspartate kinase
VLWKTVAGFLTADPDLVPEARRIPVLGRAEAVELAVHGAEVLHAGALEPAARGGIVVRVADVGDPEAPGSRIEASTPHEGPLGIAHRASLALYRETLSLGRDQGAQLAELLGELASAALEPYRVAFSGREVVALVADEERALALASRRAPRAGLVRGLATFAVVGRALASVAGLEAGVLELAGRAGAPIERAPGEVGPASLVFLVPAADLERVVRSVHAGLFGAVPAEGELLPHPGAWPREARE